MCISLVPRLSGKPGIDCFYMCMCNFPKIWGKSDILLHSIHSYYLIMADCLTDGFL